MRPSFARPLLLVAVAAALFVTACGAGVAGVSVTPSPAPATASAAPTPTPTATRSPEATASPQPTPPPSPSATATPTTRPAATPTERPAASPPPGAAAYCAVADVQTPNIDYGTSERTYLDWTYMLPRTYGPPDLVSVRTGGPVPTTYAVETLTAADVRARRNDPAYTTLLSDDPNAAVRKGVYPDLVAMRSAAAAEGVKLVVISAYRSYTIQELTFQYWVGVGGYEQALLTSARPGHSEHQLGTTMDFSDGIAAPWEYADFATTPAGAWLAAHAADYGFVMSFPKDATNVTCYDYEPWHYRWVGKDLAQRLSQGRLILRAYQADTLR